MNMNDIIVKKRDGGKLTQSEIKYVVAGCVSGEIPDYQLSALLMAIFFQKMDKEETFELTSAMRYSGDTVDLSAIRGVKVDKHSTGGVGDKTTLIAAPLAAACGVPVAKMSGRGLGFTGGTVDKLESIPGFQTALEAEDFLDQVNETGISVIGQTAHIAPADKKIYALRDVTGTVENLSLIASSIMSKKLAAGSDAIVLDVKCGSGAFMQNQADAEKLAEIMCEIGRAAGKRTVAVITDMSQPLGNAVGNSLEVIEAIQTLKGKGPEDITTLSVELAGLMIYLGGRAKTAAEGRVMAQHALSSGAGLEKLRSMIVKQGGNGEIIADYDLFAAAGFSREVTAEESGYVQAIDAKAVGLASQHTGAGRATKEDAIDLAAGIYLHKKVGDRVSRGETIATLYGSSKAKLGAAEKEVESAFTFSDQKTKSPRLIKEIIGL